MQKENPFNITFGKEPFSIISRENELNMIYDSFLSNSPNTNVYILTGIRGSGKTVAMAGVVNYFKKKKDYICVELNPESDMLEQLASKIYDEANLKKLFIKTEFNFSFKGIGFSISNENKLSNVSSFLKKELEYLSNKNIKVLISIDEVISNNYMKIFSHEFQSFLRENYKVFLIMTGLYNNISSLENQKSLTFLYRAPKIYLETLNSMAIANSYQNIFDIDEKESIILSKLTKGYAYAYQLLGNLLFESNSTKANKKILQRYDELLYENAYNIIYKELTNKEKEILKLAVTNQENSFILNELKISNSQYSNYKKNLEKKGIIEFDRKKISFKLPRFKEFLSFIIELEKED